MRADRHLAGLVLIATGLTSIVAHAQSSGTATGLAPLDFLIGTWRGTSEGQPGNGVIEREYSRILNGRFIHARNRATYAPQPKNPKGEVHEDIGIFSFDQSRKRVVFRQFHVEGFVNQYVSEPPVKDGTLVFESEGIENIPAGYRARETYVRLGPDEMEEIFELAPPGKPLEVYSRARLKRVKP